MADTVRAAAVSGVRIADHTSRTPASNCSRPAIVMSSGAIRLTAPHAVAKAAWTCPFPYLSDKSCDQAAWPASRMLPRAIRRQEREDFEQRAA